MQTYSKSADVSKLLTSTQLNVAAVIPGETLNTLAVTWQNMDTFKQNGPILGYNVYAQQNESICPEFGENSCVAPYASINQTVVATQVLGNTTTTANIAGLVSGVNYKVWAQAVGTSTFVSPNSSFSARWSTYPEVPVGPPLNDVITVRNITALTVAWALPNGTLRRGPITSYSVSGRNCTADCGDCTVLYTQSVLGAVTSHQLTGLPSHTYMRVRISAGTPAGSSSNSDSSKCKHCLLQVVV